PDALPAVVEPAREIRAQLVEAFAAQCRDLRRAGKAICQASPAEGIDPVDLVQHDLDRELRSTDLVQHVVDGLALAVLLPVGGRRTCEMRGRASRRSVSSCDSPGPRVPTPPPSRSRCCHIPRMRGRLYSSCASSTWSFPSAETACWAKMSRMSCVRSTTRTPSAFSRERRCAG